MCVSGFEKWDEILHYIDAENGFTRKNTGLNARSLLECTTRLPLKLSRISCNRSVNIVVAIILENDAILQAGWVIRYVPRGDVFALLCRVSSGTDTVFQGLRFI